MSEETAMPMDDREFYQSVGKGRVASGVSAEMYVAGALYERGYTVSKPLGGSSKYDLIVDIQGELKRVQVKSVTSKYLQVQIGWTKYRENRYDGKGSTEYVVRKYNDADFDILAVYHRPTKTIYYVPVESLDLAKAYFQIPQSDKERYLDI